MDLLDKIASERKPDLLDEVVGNFTFDMNDPDIENKVSDAMFYASIAEKDPNDVWDYIDELNVEYDKIANQPSRVKDATNSLKQGWLRLKGLPYQIASIGTQIGQQMIENPISFTGEVGLATRPQELSRQAYDNLDKTTKEKVGKYENEIYKLYSIAQSPELAMTHDDIWADLTNLIFANAPQMVASAASGLVGGAPAVFVSTMMIEGMDAKEGYLIDKVNKGQELTEEDYARANLIGGGVGIITAIPETLGFKGVENIFEKAALKYKSKLIQAGYVVSGSMLTESITETLQELPHLAAEATYRLDEMDWNEVITRLVGSAAGGATLGAFTTGSAVGTKRIITGRVLDTINNLPDAKSIENMFNPEPTVSQPTESVTQTEPTTTNVTQAPTPAVEPQTPVSPTQTTPENVVPEGEKQALRIEDFEPDLGDNVKTRKVIPPNIIEVVSEHAVQFNEKENKVKITDVLPKTDDKYYYHSTFKGNVESIKQEGLIPNKQNNWEDWSEKGYSYFAKTPKGALQWARDLFNEQLEQTGDIANMDDIVILRIEKPTNLQPPAQPVQKKPQTMAEGEVVSELEHAKAVRAAADIGGVQSVGAKNLKQADKTLEKYGEKPINKTLDKITKDYLVDLYSNKKVPVVGDTFTDKDGFRIEVSKIKEINNGVTAIDYMTFPKKGTGAIKTIYVNKLYSQPTPPVEVQPEKVKTITQQADEQVAKINTEQKPKPLNLEKMVDEELPSARGARNEDVKRERRIFGMEEIASPTRKSNKKSFDIAFKEDIAGRARDIAKDILTNQPIRLDKITEIQSGLRVRLSQLERQKAPYMSLISKETNPQEIKLLSSEVAHIQEEMDLISEALIKVGTPLGQGMQIRQALLELEKDTYSLTYMRAEVKKAKGDNLTEQESKKIDELSNKMRELEAKIAEQEATIKELQAKATLKKRGYSKYGEITKEQLNIEKTKTIENIRELLKQGCF